MLIISGKVVFGLPLLSLLDAGLVISSRIRVINDLLSIFLLVCFFWSNVDLGFEEA